MKIQVKEIVEKEVSFIRCVLPVRYDEDDMPKLYPKRKGDVWDVTIAIETGQIMDWPTGPHALKLNMKVCDEGKYYLIDNANFVIANRIEEYVIRCIPQEYGDYIAFDIDDSGRITNWEPTPESVRQAFYGHEDGD